MRSVFAIFLLPCACTLALASGRPVTVILDFDSLHPAAVTRAMQQEAARLLSDFDYEPEWRTRESVGSSESFERMAVVRFHGPCTVAAPAGAEMRAKTALGYVHVERGDVLPFAEIDCSRIRDYVAPEISRADSGARQHAYGRALGRVVAHELDHILTKTTQHESAGILHESFSSSDLAGTAAFESAR